MGMMRGLRPRWFFANHLLVAYFPTFGYRDWSFLQIVAKVTAICSKLPIFSKIFRRIMLSHLLAVDALNDALPDHQFMFRGIGLPSTTSAAPLNGFGVCRWRSWREVIRFGGQRCPFRNVYDSAFLASNSRRVFRLTTEYRSKVKRIQHAT